jgi:hypothetical protein
MAACGGGCVRAAAWDDAQGVAGRAAPSGEAQVPGWLAAGGGDASYDGAPGCGVA